MYHEVSRWPLTQTQVHARVSQCGICGKQSGAGTGFSLCSSVFPCQYDSTMALHSHISWG
jgi:hypothetical protein